MCERCLQLAEITALNAQAVLEMANAATTLTVNVPGSEAAVKNILGRLENLTKLPQAEDAKAPGQTEPVDVKAAYGTAPEDGLPPELAVLAKLFKSMGIHADFVNLGKL